MYKIQYEAVYLCPSVGQILPKIKITNIKPGQHVQLYVAKTFTAFADLEALKA
jgi:hypothetical protein